MSNPPPTLLLDHLDLLTDLNQSLPVLDLACGDGRAGMLLAEHGIPVVFADKSASAIITIEQQLGESGLPGRMWQVDLEQPGINPFSGQYFSGVVGFRYLFRPLFPALLAAVIPDGLVIYETFTVQQRLYGQPRNADFLLQPGELKTTFKDWKVIHYFEGVLKNPDRSVAQIVARKPLRSTSNHSG